MFSRLNVNKRYTAFGLILFAILTISLLGSMLHLAIKHKHKLNAPIVIDSLESSFEYASHVPSGTSVMSEEEFDALQGTTTFKTYVDYVASVDTSFKSTTPTITASGANADLFDYCDKYFHVYYGAVRLSPIFPMALANVETPGRADFTKTWSSLFPSAVADVSKMGTFCITDVVENSKTFYTLSTEYSTRDRGALQMSPTYGTDNSTANSMMSGNEVDKLSKVNTTHCLSWCEGASSSSGDRFYLPDVLLRVQAAMESNITNIYKNGYVPETDMQLIAMLAVGHNTGSNAWSNSSHDRVVGRWYSAQKCYDMCEKAGSAEMVAVLTDYAKTNSYTYITTEVAKSLYSQVYTDKFSDYCSNDTNPSYPIKTLYSYIKLSLLYTE